MFLTPTKIMNNIAVLVMGVLASFGLLAGGLPESEGYCPHGSLENKAGAEPCITIELCKANPSMRVDGNRCEKIPTDQIVCDPGQELRGNKCYNIKSVDTRPVIRPRGGCLIATAAGGTEMVPDVQNLREVRERLYESESGWLMHGINSMYYTFSPEVADLQRSSPVLNGAVRTLITPMMAVYSLVDPDSPSLGAAVVLATMLNAGLYVGLPAVACIGFRRMRASRTIESDRPNHP